MSAFARPLGEQVDDGVKLIGKRKNEKLTRQRMREWLDRATPEDLDGLRDEPLILDALRDLQAALLNASHPYEPAVIKALGELHSKQYDEVWDQCGGNEV